MNFFRRFRRSLLEFKRFPFTSDLKQLSAISRKAGPQQAPTMGVALGGGFARGLAHIGVLKVLEEEGIPIDYVAGTSVGAVIGAAYCSGVSAKEMEEIARTVRFKDFARYTPSRFGLCSNDRMIGFLQRVLKVKTFEELRLPLAVIATEFTTGEAVVFRQGSLIDPVRASCAYPGFFQPVTVDGRIMVDGLLAHSVPVRPVRSMGAQKVVAVCFTGHWVKQGSPRHVLDVIGQCFSIAQANMKSLWQSEADLLIEPAVTGFAFDAFDRAADLVRAGEEATRTLLPTLKSWFPKPQDDDAMKAPLLAGRTIESNRW